ncbi:hypothetical protein ACFVR2_01660 [Gottfriedia sp. NPDC057991]|uniref:hypothetical protein n=1 Tax=Gottfriedia sp. NPDC057991 TaxID=3346298 RepID=UPI0036DB01F8
MENRVVEIEKEINKLITDLLIPIRASKAINKEAFDKLFLLLEEVKTLVSGELTINRRLAGLLFFIYTSVSAEAEHTHYSNPIFIVVAKLEDYLGKILWDSPFGNGI